MDVDHSYSVQSASIMKNEFTPSRFQPLDGIIIDFMRQQHIPGGSLAISHNGMIIYTQGYGVSHAGQAVLSSSLFRLASISKTITAVGVMKLVQEDRLKLDQRVFGPHGILSRFRPTAKGDKRIVKITVKHLLQHSAGWDRDQAGDAVFWKLHKVTRDRSDEALIRYMMSKKLQFTPGKRHAYSNLGYLILGKVIEAVTGMPYIDYIQEISRDILPGYGRQIDCYPLEVKYFNNRQNTLEPSVYPEEGLVQAQYGGFNMEGTESYGGLVMSAVDLLVFLNQLSRNMTLTNDSFIMMIARPDYEHGEQWYGLGLDVQDGGRSWGHTGAMEGTSTTMCHHKSGLSWALLFNTWATDMDLDGLVKYGLSKTSCLPMWRGIMCKPECCIQTKSQTIHLLMSMEEVHASIRSGLVLSQANMIIYQGRLYVNTIWQTTTTETFIHIYKNIHNIDLLIRDSNLTDACVYMLETFYFKDDMYYIIGMKENPVKIYQQVYINVTADDHLTRMKNLKKSGFVMKIQSVATRGDSITVSAVYGKENRSCDRDLVSQKKSRSRHTNVSWLQITLENFVFELGKNMTNSLVLTHVDCFSVQGEPYVSAVWVPGDQRKYLQRHDVSIYGFLYELQESVDIRLDHVCSYYNEGVLNFLAVWSQ